MNFEFHNPNILNTTTMVAVGTGSTTVSYLFDRDSSTQYQTSGKNDDTVGITIGVEFATSENIDRILLQNINLESFTIYHSSNAANTITLTSTCGTTTSEWTGNAATNTYLYFATIAATSIFIAATVTMVTDQEKKIGQLWINANQFRMTSTAMPSYKGYKPLLDRKEYLHELAGGGWTTYVMGDYYRSDIKMKYVLTATVDDLKDLYESNSPFVFAPFPTGTAWSGEIYEVNWVKDWEFLRMASNDYQNLGYEGRMRLHETPR